MIGRRPPTIAAQHTRWLAAVFVAVELIILSSVILFVLLPLARRSADDFVGLAVISAKTWVELPPQTRPAFEAELGRVHRIALRPDMLVPPDTGLVHGPYIYFIELAFQRQIGRKVFFVEEPGPDGEAWLWTAIASGGRHIGVGFAWERIRTYPLIALLIATVAGAALVCTVAWRLARRITQPVSRLEQAAAQLTQGSGPPLLPETGPLELAELSRHFNRMAQQLAELNDARTTLFAGISHDLRTPLARMRLALEMIDPPPPPAVLRRLENDIEQMNRQITLMLEIARGLSTEPGQDIHLSTWLHDRKDAHAQLAADVGATLRIQCDPALHVRAGPGMLGRVFGNLLENALRYAPGPIDLTAHGARASNGDSVVRIGVRDRGPAIPADQLEAVFRPFHRVDRSRTPKTGGFGLGLAIVRQLAKANGWRVSLASRTGGGLEAWIEIPLEN